MQQNHGGVRLTGMAACPRATGARGLVKTQTLKAIQSPQHTLELLESFATHALRVPATAQRVNRLDDLPLQLRRHVGIGPGKQYVWFAWMIEERVWLVTGTLSLELARERGQPVLEVRSYDAEGLLDEAATWVNTGSTEWVRSQW